MKEFESVIGYESVKKELERLCDVLKNNEKYARLGVEMPHGLMLYGEPGVGKTTMANCFIAALGWKVFLCRKAKSDGEFVDEIKKTFEDAKAQAPSVVFLDDLDKFANDDENHTNSEEYVTVQSCIDGVRGKGVFVLATANNTRNFPKSLLRSGRFDTVIEIDTPDGKDAEKIIAHYLSQKKFVADVDTEAIAHILEGKSCADLERVVNEAGIFAGFAGKETIDMDSIVRACMRVIFNAPEDEERYSLSAQKRIAYHEAGHAVIAEVLEEGSVNLASVCMHDSRTGGIASVSQSPDYFTSTTYMESRVLSLLGGRAATELVFGEIDTGASSDLHRAFDIVARLVDDYAGRGFAQYTMGDCGHHVTDSKDGAIRLEMERYYFRAKKILVENKAFLDALAEALFEKKTLLGAEIRKIKAASKEAA